MTTHSAAPTGAITLPTQLTRLRNAPSGWAAVCPWTALLVAGAPPRFWAWTNRGENWRRTIKKRNMAANRIESPLDLRNILPLSELHISVARRENIGLV